MTITRRQMLAATGGTVLSLLFAGPAQAKPRRLRHLFPSKALMPSRTLYPH